MVVVAPNPELDIGTLFLGSQRPVMRSDPDRPEVADLLETEGWVTRVGLQELEALVCGVGILEGRAPKRQPKGGGLADGV